MGTQSYCIGLCKEVEVVKAESYKPYLVRPYKAPNIIVPKNIYQDLVDFFLALLALYFFRLVGPHARVSEDGEKRD